MTPPCAFEQPESAVATILDRHARQRADDHPAVSVLVGDVSMCGHHGNRWAASQGQGVVEVDAPCSGPAVAWVAAALLRQRDLVVDALGELSRRTGRPKHVLQAEGAARTGSERSLWLDRLGGCDGAGDVDRLCRAVLTQWGTETFDVEERGRFPTPQESVEWPPARLLGTMSRLIPAAELPAVAFVWRDDSCDRLADTAEELFLLAGAAPRIPMALLMPPAARPVLVAVENNARAMAFLREGLIEPGESSEHGAGVVVRDQVDFPTGHRAGEATDSCSGADADNAARSAAERFLYDVLEATPATTGLFGLNVKLDFPFGGGRAAEVDLACLRFKLAIEIDGHYHFVEAEAYRRDRRKDLALQRRGWLVMRFLADDVGPRQEEIVAAIMNAVDERRREIPG